MFYCIELQRVLKTSTLLMVDKYIIYKRTPWKGSQIRKLNITTMFHKTTFKKFYGSAIEPVAFSTNKQKTYYTRAYPYVKYVRFASSLIKRSEQFRLEQ